LRKIGKKGRGKISNHWAVGQKKNVSHIFDLGVFHPWGANTWNLSARPGGRGKKSGMEIVWEGNSFKKNSHVRGREEERKAAWWGLHPW